MHSAAGLPEKLFQQLPARVMAPRRWQEIDVDVRGKPVERHGWRNSISEQCLRQRGNHPPRFPVSQHAASHGGEQCARRDAPTGHAALPLRVEAAGEVTDDLTVKFRHPGMAGIKVSVIPGDEVSDEFPVAEETFHGLAGIGGLAADVTYRLAVARLVCPDDHVFGRNRAIATVATIIIAAAMRCAIVKMPK